MILTNIIVVELGVLSNPYATRPHHHRSRTFPVSGSFNHSSIHLIRTKL